MRPIRIYRVSAIILRHRDLGEADQIVVLLSRERGKFSAIAKGIKRPRSKLASALQLFTHSDLLLAVGQSLDIVSQCQIVRSFYQIRKDLTKVAYANHLTELVDGFLQERSPSGQIFDLLLWALGQLETGNDPELIARAFELKLMSALGYRPRLLSCASCGKQLGSGPVRFSADLGGAVCSSCQDQAPGTMEVSPHTLAAAQQLIEGKLAEIPKVELSPQIRQELERAMRIYIEYRLERQLRSSRFIRGLKAKIS